MKLKDDNIVDDLIQGELDVSNFYQEVRCNDKFIFDSRYHGPRMLFSIFGNMMLEEEDK